MRVRINLAVRLYKGISLRRCLRFGICIKAHLCTQMEQYQSKFINTVIRQLEEIFGYSKSLFVKGSPVLVDK